MSPYVWMFISSYEKLRALLINQKTITSLIQLEYSGFDGATVPICTFTLENRHKPNYRGAYIRLSDFKGAVNQAPKTLEAIRNPDCGWFYRVSADEFQKIPGSPIAYWVSEKVYRIFQKERPLGQKVMAKQGLATGDNDIFMRAWNEVDNTEISFSSISCEDSKKSRTKWFPYNKGGQFRKWYGNFNFVVNWKDNGEEIKNFKDDRGKLRSRPQNTNCYFREGITWSD